MKKLFALVVVIACLSGVGQAQDPSTLPLLQQSSLSYLGGFRVPNGLESGVSSTLAFNPANNSLFVGTWKYLSEVTIPTPVNSADVSKLPLATFRQGLAEPAEGRLGEVAPGVVEIGGFLPYGNRLIGSAYVYYDGNNVARRSHFARSLTLATPSFSGWSQVWQDTKQGYVAGYMATVPLEWQAKLGGPAITGQCCVPIISRTSLGPAMFAFDPAQIGQATVPATPLLYYPITNATLGSWESLSPEYSASAHVNGAALIAGTRTALFVGSNGLGPFCYGTGSECNDPVIGSQAPHNYPYRSQIWAYDLNCLADVKAGTKQPWACVPYGVWPLTFPVSTSRSEIGGVGYDAARQIIYVSQKGADGLKPIIHAFKVNATATPPPTTTVTVSVIANPTSITAGQSSALSWSSTGVTSVVIDQGVGTMTQASGSRTVSPTATTTYTATATGAGGTATSTATVTVTAAPPPPPTNTTPPAPPPPVDPRIAELEAAVAERDARLAQVKVLLQQALVQAPRNTARVVKDAIVKALALIP